MFRLALVRHVWHIVLNDFWDGFGDGSSAVFFTEQKKCLKTSILRFSCIVGGDAEFLSLKLSWRSLSVVCRACWTGAGLSVWDLSWWLGGMRNIFWSRGREVYGFATTKWRFVAFLSVWGSRTPYLTSKCAPNVFFWYSRWFYTIFCIWKGLLDWANARGGLCRFFARSLPRSVRRILNHVI